MSLSNSFARLPSLQSPSESAVFMDSAFTDSRRKRSIVPRHFAFRVFLELSMGLSLAAAYMNWPRLKIAKNRDVSIPSGAHALLTSWRVAKPPMAQIWSRTNLWIDALNPFRRQLLILPHEQRGPLGAPRRSRWSWLVRWRLPFAEMGSTMIPDRWALSFLMRSSSA